MFKKLRSINLSETPLAEEKGDALKKEILIILDGLGIRMINGEEVTDEEIEEAKEEKKAAEEARIAAEKEAREAAEEEARRKAEEENAAE